MKRDRMICISIPKEKETDFRLFTVLHGGSIEDTNHWIPVTETLPEPAQEVLVTYTSNGRNRFVEIGSIWEGEWALANDEYMIPGSTRTVLAWKPMPEPYRGEVKS